MYNTSWEVDVIWHHFTSGFAHTFRICYAVFKFKWTFISTSSREANELFSAIHIQYPSVDPRILFNSKFKWNRRINERVQRISIKSWLAYFRFILLLYFTEHTTYTQPKSKFKWNGILREFYLFSSFVSFWLDLLFQA